MYDMNKIASRTWDIIFINGDKLSILPWKLKDKIKSGEYIRESSDTIEGLIKCAVLILNSNKEGKIYTEDVIKELFDEYLLADFVEKYTNWLNEVSDEKN